MPQDDGGAKVIGVGCVDIGPKEKEYVNRVLDSGLVTAGPVLDKFETDFAAVHGCRHGLFLNSGTDALRCALAALKEANGWSDGDEVIVPALTFIATSNIVLQNAMKPVFADVDPETFNINPAEIPFRITPNTRAIIVVHLFGLPCDMRPILAAAKKYGLKIIEDSCETMGVKYRGKVVGSFGDIACFSTYAAHVITTGVGGLAITNDIELSKLMRSYANHGRDPQFLGFRDSFRLNPQKYEKEGQAADLISKRFSFQRIGYSARGTQLEAALGLAQLKRLPEILQTRSDNYFFLNVQLSETPGIRLQKTPEESGHAAMMFPIVLTNPTLSRADVMKAIEDRGVETRPFFNILGQRPYLTEGNREDLCPEAKYLSRQGFYVACHHLLDPRDLWQIADVVKDAVGAQRKVAA